MNDLISKENAVIHLLRLYAEAEWYARNRLNMWLESEHKLEEANKEIERLKKELDK